MNTNTEKLSVREVEKLVKGILKPDDKPKKEETPVVEEEKIVVPIEISDKDLTEEEKKAIENRAYVMRKIKHPTKLELSRLLPTNLDIRKTTKTVENGLLTIRIPVKEEEKPLEIEVE